MFGITVKTVDETKQVVKAVARTAFRNLGHAVAAIRRFAMQLITRDSGPSAPGEPPHTRRGLFDRAMLYYVDKDRDEAVVGTAFSVAGTAGQAHEFGGTYKSGKYPERPFMAPALAANLDRFHRSWGSSIG